MTEPTFRKLVNLSLRQAWRCIIAVLGTTIVLIGVVMLVTPGPALVVIPIGVAILAVEFVWARRLLRRIKVATKWKLRTLKRSSTGNAN